MFGETPAFTVHDRRFHASLLQDVARWAEENAHLCARTRRVVLQAPSVFSLLCRASLDPQVGPAHRRSLFNAMVYFKDGLDAIPDTSGNAAGYVDDLVVSAYVLRPVLATEPAGSACCSLWDGDGALANYLDDVETVATDLLGRGRLTTLRRLARYC